MLGCEGYNKHDDEEIEDLRKKLRLERKKKKRWKRKYLELRRSDK